LLFHAVVLQAEQGQIQIHTENIFPIIKKAVYSGHEVFLRELVSNGVDAISKRRMAAMAGDCSEGPEPKISIRIDREAKTLTISDNGIGMSADEVKRYINQVAFSSAEDFLETGERRDHWPLWPGLLLQLHGGQTGGAGHTVGPRRQ